MKKQTLTYIGLFILALVVRLFIIQLDPFLNDWDERFHALVARNLSENLFLPLLNQKHILPFDIREWDVNQVWLHKQPLFLWQMALSIKLFGINEIAVRIPSAIMGALATLLVYRIVFLSFSQNTKIALSTALLWCFSFYQLNLTSGLGSMDHNDVAFSFYILCSVWAYYEFLLKKNWRWAIGIGVFVGCAILNKWLTGLLVFAPWGLSILQNYFKTKKTDEIKYFLLSLGVSLIVFLPWQFYILHRFPVEAAHEYLLNRKHLTIAVEGHSGEWYFYLQHFNQYFGKYIVFLIPIGLLVAFRKLNRFHFSNMVMTGVVFIFFSFVAMTKIPSFFFIVVPLLLIYLVAGFFTLIKLFNLEKVYWLLFLPLLWFTLKPLELKKNHSPEGEAFKRKEKNTIVYKKLSQEINKDVHIFGMPTRDNIELMFYNPHVLSCARDTDFSMAIEYLNKGYEIAMFTQVLTAEQEKELTGFPNFTLIEDEIQLQ